MTKPPSVGDVFEILGDENTRCVLAAINRNPRSAEGVSEATGLSLSTVYRRLDSLETHDFITGRTVVAPDGSHRSVYESDFDSTVIAMNDGEFAAHVYETTDISDRFTDLWDDLGAD